MVGVCHYRLGMLRDAKRELEAAFALQPMVFTALLLGKVHVRLDQPLGALDCYEAALDAFPGSPELLAAVARVHEGVGDLKKSVESCVVPPRVVVVSPVQPLSLYAS
jgi:tetratricopeptide (TPR) repeat protein